jgi:lipid II:glycine glycyltransferase (peptidoglycan interpeptide bridge formation enzyme)
VLQKNLPLGRSMLYSQMVGSQEVGRITNQELRIKNNEADRQVSGSASQRVGNGLEIKSSFIDQIREIGKREKAIFYRLELDIPIHNSSFIIHDPNFIKAFEEMQPEHTRIVDISRSEEEILSQMKPKGRYNIKVAEKHQVKVRPGTIDNFYKLYEKMARRQKISFRNRNYFQKLVDILAAKEYLFLFEAYFFNGTQETVLAAAIITFFEGRATYLFGGSSDEQKNLMAPYKLHWEIIRAAKERNCCQYDLFGIAPPTEPNHPWRGVTDFKEKFGGHAVALAGSFDLIFRPIEYQLFRLAEKIRKH